jgi:hypothetical protein
MAVELTKVLKSSNGNIVATAIFDKGWILRPRFEPLEHYCGSETALWDYWHKYFDSETGIRKRSDY